MKKIVILLLCIFVFSYAKSVNGMNQSFDKQVAIQNAHWKAFELILKDLTGHNAYKGSVKKSFKLDFEKDFETFKNEYFDFSTHQCENKGEDGYLCLVQGNINLEKIRAILSEKSNQSTTMGKEKMGNLKIVLIDDISNEISRDFIDTLQSDLNNSGHSFIVLPKGTIVGKKGKKCESIKSKIKKYKKMGNSYKSAVRASKRKLEECEENQDIEYAFSLNKLKIKNVGESTHGEMIGTLTYRITMFNTQSKKQDQAVKPLTLKAYAEDKDTLYSKLFTKASQTATRDMTNNLLSYVSKKQNKKSKQSKKLNSYEYMYTVILMGITMDGNDRGKRRIIRDAIKKFNAKPKRNGSESTDYEQVYNFGINDELDI